jgi:cytoskeletal protein CcmA (bactofilin family)
MFKGLKPKVFGGSLQEAQPSPAATASPPAAPERHAEIQVRRLEDRSSPDDSVVSAQASFNGELSGRAGVRVAGEVEGDIRCEGLVWIKATATVKGNVFSGYVILEGRLEGDIGPSHQVELRSSARMRGNIRTKLLAVAEGSQFEGRIDMAASSGGPARFTEKRQPKSGRR